MQESYFEVLVRSFSYFAFLRAYMPWFAWLYWRYIIIVVIYCVFMLVSMHLGLWWLKVYMLTSGSVFTGFHSSVSVAISGSLESVVTVGCLVGNASGILPVWPWEFCIDCFLTLWDTDGLEVRTRWNLQERGKNTTGNGGRVGEATAGNLPQYWEWDREIGFGGEKGK